ncbi:OLC1v1005670C1 [Oldenlandia corymbosa var. corymbosa]|uniref:Multiple inositol polyphosphate phosphatase 1 n=1 Tax=Oldenlandia corymbosa var. corymbosa TaxID=529605 RepID=A0AAV1DF62_OLDCO|nr:OLC1v1005670C1 [Oldenlandia corymbosa var. corymbosa]
MERAIESKEEGFVPGSYEKAQMRFAHAETLVPFSCLLGLFLEGSEFELIRRSLQLPPKPSQKRNWRGSILAPFAGNNILVLYNCPAVKSSKYFVHILHNEHPVPLPQETAAPHLKHNYETLCNIQQKQPEKKHVQNWGP